MPKAQQGSCGVDERRCLQRLQLTARVRDSTQLKPAGWLPATTRLLARVDITTPDKEWVGPIGELSPFTELDYGLHYSTLPVPRPTMLLARVGYLENRIPHASSLRTVFLYNAI